MPQIETKRRLGEEDLAEVAALLAAARAADGHAPLGEHKWLDLVQGGRAGFAGFVAREPGHQALVGYAQLSRGEDSWAVEYVVHPARRDGGEGAEGERIAGELLRAALDEARRGGGGHLHLWVPKPTAANDRVAAALGLRRGRELLQLRRPLPIEEELAAAAVATRPFCVGEDERAWLEVNASAFAGHPEQGGWDLSTLHDREGLAWFDPGGFLLLERAGHLAGFCWTKVHADESPALGEIFVIGVDPSHQGEGLGRALLAAGLVHLAGVGVATAMLYVDADNAAATALYASFGFSVDHHDLAYVTDLAPA